MVLKSFALICLLACAACQQALSPHLPTATPVPTAAETNSVDDYVEIRSEGVRLGIEVPQGWKWRPTKDGLLITEKQGSMKTIMGMQVHFFVHSISGYDIPAADSVNVALWILNQISRDPHYIGQGAVSDPQGFEWDGHDAAYYLLNNGDGSVSMLIALTVQPLQRMIVCNISSPNDRSQSIRVMLPNLLGTLTVNGVTMDLAAVNALPNPLVFPDYEEQPESTTEAASTLP
jgi:hypothetical protein